MMKAKTLTWLAIAMVLFVVAFAAGCGEASDEVSTSAGAATTDTSAGAQPAGASDEVFELTYANFLPATHPLQARMEQWAADISDATNGRVKITLYPAQTLLTGTEAFEGILQGIADMGMVTTSYSPGRFPLFELFDLPVDYNDCQVSAKVLWDCYQKFQPEEFSKVKLLCCFATSPGGVATTKPVRTLEDLKGMQIRATGLTANYMSALGAVPVSIPMPEAYEALSRGVCDGTINAWDSLVSFKVIEAVDYVTMTEFLYCAPMLTVMNLDTWNSLPPDIQAAIEKRSEEQTAIDAKAEAEQALDNIKRIMDLGKEIILLTEEEEARWKEAVKPAIDAAIQEREAKGLPAREFYDELVRLAEQYNPDYPGVKDSYLEMLK